MTTYVPVSVPEEYVLAIYEFLAQRAKEDAPAIESGDPQQSPKRELSEALVREMYRDSESRHQALMEYLASRADEWVTSTEVIEVLALPSRKSLAGVFGAFGRRAKHRYGGVKPWGFSWDSDEGEGSYRMSSQVAEWILDQAAKS